MLARAVVVAACVLPNLHVAAHADRRIDLGQLYARAKQDRGRAKWGEGAHERRGESWCPFHAMVSASSERVRPPRTELGAPSMVRIALMKDELVPP